MSVPTSDYLTTASADYTTWRDQLPTPDQTPSIGNSPENGPAAAEARTEGGLSFPVAPTALQAQLEAWANLNLDAGANGHGWHPTSGADGWGAQGAADGPLWGSPHNSFHGEPGPSCVTDSELNILVGSFQSQHSFMLPPPPPPTHEHPHLLQQQGLAADDEDLSVAAKDDKRKRNTTASARFRVKKKERERQLEEERVTLREKVTGLEKEVNTLKHENAWLRELILEKTKPVNLSLRGDETPMPKASD